MNHGDNQSEGMIGVYLGEAAAVGGPFALLGVRHCLIDDSIILRACQRRLDQINSHIRGQTPGADEVRMAVHAAASQLLDQELRLELAKHWPEGTDDAETAWQSPKAWRVHETTALDERIKRQAFTLLGACGGWNARSRKRLGQFARLHQISAAQLVAGITEGQNNGIVLGSSRRVGDSTATGRVRGPSVIDTEPVALPWALIPVVFVMMSLVLISVGYMKYREKEQLVRVDTAIAVRGENAGTTVKGFQSPGGGGLEGRVLSSERRHYSAIIFELDQFAKDGVDDLESGERFSRVGKRLVNQWTAFSAEELDVAVENVKKVLGGILNPELFEASSSFLFMNNQNSESSMLARGLRSWFFGNGSLEPSYSAMVGRGTVIGEPGAFGRSLLGEYLAIAEQGTDDPAWWSWWIEQLEPLERIEGGGGVARDSILLDTVYRRLIDKNMGQNWDQCARQVVQALQWGTGSAARSWMIGIVVDPKVQSGRLAILSRAMVLYSSAKGLGMDMMVEADDSIAERKAYQKKLRARWANTDGRGDDIRSQLISRIELLLQMTSSDLGRNQSMQRAVELAKVNSACWARGKNDDAGVYALIDSFDIEPGVATSTRKVFDLTSSSGDEQWATRARNLEAAEELSEHLGALDRVTPIGPKSAHALVYLAMQAPNLGIRAEAEGALLARRDEPAILIALDRVVGAKRATRRMVELINRYIGIQGDLSDSAFTRRALLEHLVSVGVLDHEQVDNGVEVLSRGIDDAYSLRSLSGSGRSSGARGVYEQLLLSRLIVGREVPAKVRGRLLVRLRMSDGPMQRFTAYQAAVLELRAESIVHTQPGLAWRVQRILDGTIQRQQGTGDVVVQIMLIERALAELWLIELEMEGVS